MSYEYSPSFSPYSSILLCNFFSFSIYSKWACYLFLRLSSKSLFFFISRSNFYDKSFVYLLYLSSRWLSLLLIMPCSVAILWYFSFRPRFFITYCSKDSLIRLLSLVNLSASTLWIFYSDLNLFRYISISPVTWFNLASKVCIYLLDDLSLDLYY